MKETLTLTDDSATGGEARDDARPADDPVASFCGAATPKHHLSGTHRACEPAETWSRLAPRLSEFGITRVGDITGLDRIGIPVWIAVRPNSRSLSVSQGKGLDHVAARVSAAMECVEIAHAEQPARPLRFESYAELREVAEVVDVSTLPPARNSLFTPERKLLWIEAYDLLRGASVWVPYEMVHTDATVPWMPGSGAFLASTNGLASGNNLAEAVLHGLCEVIERDALAMWEFSGEEFQAATRLDLSTTSDPVVGELLERYSRAGISVMAWDITGDVGIPVVQCVIFDTGADPLFKPMPAAFGAGCHPSRVVALTRAMTEAAQSRLTVIAGSRDDFGRARYRTTQDPEALEYNRGLVTEQPAVLPFGSLPTWTSETVDGDLRRVLDLLRGVGVPQVLAIDLSIEGMPVSVARVIVPVLEGPTESAAYLPGVRVRALSERLRSQ
jgi:ribosomal protein S12 methylthiotransferase accessory factor